MSDGGRGIGSPQHHEQSDDNLVTSLIGPQNVGMLGIETETQIKIIIIKSVVGKKHP